MPLSQSTLAAPRVARRLTLLVVLAGCSSGSAIKYAPAPDVPVDRVRALLGALSADSMEGRFTGSPGAARAARLLADELARAGVEPAGDSGFFQRVPIHVSERQDGRLRYEYYPSIEALRRLPTEQQLMAVNVVGKIPGAGGSQADTAVVIGAHFDHLGIRRPIDGDSIYNGADDDGSGVVAAVEIARALAQGPRPKRTVVIVLSTGEEIGVIGMKYYAEHPVVPLSRTVADLQIEMIGRADPKMGGRGEAWLTGFDRSTMGEILQAAKLAIRPDPRPAQDFFSRSDNIVLAQRGVPAHTLSTFGLHADYHRPSDEADRIDYPHLAAVIHTAIGAARVLADGPAPTWHPGGRPLGGF